MMYNKEDTKKLKEQSRNIPSQPDLKPMNQPLLPKGNDYSELEGNEPLNEAPAEWGVVRNENQYMVNLHYQHYASRGITVDTSLPLDHK
jgi:hypothetical protein